MVTKSKKTIEKNSIPKHIDLEFSIHNFHATDNLLLTGILNKSKSNPNKTILIHLHGLTSNCFSAVGRNVAYSANQNQIDTLILNTRGNGVVTSFKETLPNGDKKYFTGGTAYEKFEDSENDIQGAINYCKYLGYKNIILSGHSTGCQKITYYQLQNPKNRTVKGLILLAPGDDLNCEKRDNPNFKQAIAKAKELIKQKKNALLASYDFGIMSPKRYYDLFKKTSIEGNLFNYTKNLIHLNEIKCPVFCLIGQQDPYFLDIEKANTNINNNLKNKNSFSKIIAGDHGYRSGEDELIKELDKIFKQNYK